MPRPMAAEGGELGVAVGTDGRPARRVGATGFHPRATGPPRTEGRHWWEGGGGGPATTGTRVRGVWHCWEEKRRWFLTRVTTSDS